MLAVEQYQEPEIQSEKLVPVHFPVAQDDPFELIQFTTVLMAYLKTPKEFTHALVEFTSPEVMESIDKNPAEHYLLGVIWLTALKRMIEDHPASAFPYEMLNLPLIFQEWNWHYDLTDEWKDIYDALLVRAANLPTNVEEHVHVGVQLFCLEAIFKQDTPSPFEGMISRFERSLPHQHCTEATLSMGMILGRNGWMSGY
jgi:hypothetical protein